jgi:hypothetical protein
MAETNTFEMTPETLARAIANGARRERNRAAKVADDASDVALGEGKLEIAQALQIVAESIRSGGGAAAAVIPDEQPEQIVEEQNPDELPSVHHIDDFAEGAALVRSGADRRLVVGYNGASGHLRD